MSDKVNPLFDTLNLITTKEYPTWIDLPEIYQTNYNQYMINRFLSSYDYLFPLLSEITKYRLSDEQHYNIMIQGVRKMKHYFNYKAYKKEDEDTLLIKAIEKEYEIGRREAKSYIKDLPISEQNKLKDKWSDYFKFSAQN